MKTILFLTVSFCTTYAFGQEQKEVQSPTQKVEPITKKPTAQAKEANYNEVRRNKAVTISKKAGEPQQVHNKAYYDAEIAKIDARIAAIDTKIAHVNATPSEKAYAEQNGWFTQMEEAKTELNQRRATLVAKRDNL